MQAVGAFEVCRYLLRELLEVCMCHVRIERDTLKLRSN